MLALISPAKKLDFKSPWCEDLYTQPCCQKQSQILVDQLKDMPLSQLQSMMKLSDKLGVLNYERYKNYNAPFTACNAKPAVYAFHGDTYMGLEAGSLSKDDMNFAQDNLRILSGLYGILRPLDLIQPYRLEMGTKLDNHCGSDLYDFWSNTITNYCNDELKSHKNNVIISLASNEYIKSINIKKLDGKLITCHFKEIKDGSPKVIGIFAKRARGMMARYIIQNRIEATKEIKGFNMSGYKFVESLSNNNNYVFTRKQP